MEDRTLRRGGSGRREVRAPRVQVVAGPDAGAEATAQEAALSVGTAADNGLCLSDRTVSRYHLELLPAGDGVRVRDVGSLNGTWLGAVRVADAVVPAGTELTIGDTRVRVGSLRAEGEAAPEGPPIAGMVAQSEAMRAVAAQVRLLAKASVSALVRGETGTGKEVVARALHALGPRASGPFVVVDCGSMPATLIASELFGHERGAFTGADRAHAGAFERADGGTVFLDEVGELPMAVQPALLGALERRSFRRVGGTKELTVDVRVLSATHRDLRAEVNEDRFRADLYYRIAVAQIVIPPLRERPEDVEPLVRHFVLAVTGAPELPFGPETMAALARHRWTGNARELRNVVEAAVAMGEVRLEATRRGAAGALAGATGEEVQPYKEARGEVLRAFEERYLGALIARTGGNASEAARVARMDRQYLLGLLRRYGLR